MIAIITVAIVLLVALYLLWRYTRRLASTNLGNAERTLSPPLTALESQGRARVEAYRRPGRGPAGRSVPETRSRKSPGVEFIQKIDVEVAEDAVLTIPEAEIDFSKYPEFGEDYVVLIVRDSDMLFAYWEVTFEAIDRYARTTGDRTRPGIVLRIYDAEDLSPVPWFLDIPVNSRLGNYYLPVPPRGKAFYAEIGLLGSSGFWPVARSTIAVVPASVFGESPRERFARERFEEYVREARMSIGISSR